MVGEMPTFVFAETGEFLITLTVTAEGHSIRDSVRVTVVEPPEAIFIETGGQVVMEAENFWINDRRAARFSMWESDTARPGFSGDSYMEAKDTQYEKFDAGYGTTAPEMRYAILFQQPGTYRVWMRGLSETTTYDSCHVNLNGVERNSNAVHRFAVDANAFLWTGNSHGNGPQTVIVPEPGVHYLSVWIRESGLLVDKIILTRDTGFVPNGLGPEESEHRASVANAFIRGDANGDRSVDLADAFAIAFFLFDGRETVPCEDRGDVDDNGELQLTDIIVLLEFLFRRGPQPDAPFPFAGLDTTKDAFDCGDL